LNDAGWRMPAEASPHERTVLCWPTRVSLWGEFFAAAEDAHAEVARTVARFEPVSVICAPGAGNRVAERCGAGVDVVELPLDDSWFRDSGPIYVVDGTGGRRARDFVFNGWGEKYRPFDRDAALAAEWAAHADHPAVPADLVLEGGAVTVDGAGTVVTTEQCLLHPNRNPSLSRRQIELALAATLGTPTVVWLPFGLADDHDTDGHVDNVAAFARPGRLVVQGCDDPAEPDADRLEINRRCAEGHLDAAGEPIRTVTVPVLPFVDIGGHRRPVPYLNFYVGNGFVAVPTAPHPADDDMLAIIAAEFPGREVVAVPVGAVLAFGGGGIHCITQQVPVP
jgi:agmatine deiminase